MNYKRCVKDKEYFGKWTDTQVSLTIGTQSTETQEVNTVLLGKIFIIL